MRKNTVYVISGQTATGKTDLACALARRIGGQLIAADSRQCYSKLDIISGKDIEENAIFTPVDSFNNYTIGWYPLQGTRIWLYDMVDPKSTLSAYDWALCAHMLIEQCIAQEIPPIIVGGTWFYIYALLHGISHSTKPNPQLRQELQELSVEELQQKVQTDAPNQWDAMNHSDQNNPRRLLRIIERLQNEFGEPLEGINNNYHIKGCHLLYGDKSALDKRIALRVAKRIQNGAFEEVETLLRLGYDRNDPGMQTIGYQQLMAYSVDEYSKEEAVAIWEKKEVQYAKRQKTFMKKDTQLLHIDPQGKNLDELVSMVY